VHFVTVLSDRVRAPWFFCAALVGPIANLTAAPLPESNAGADCGIAAATAPIPISRKAWRPMMFMIALPAQIALWLGEVQFFRTQVEHGVWVDAGKLISIPSQTLRLAPAERVRGAVNQN
jgi:hypothetical protein